MRCLKIFLLAGVLFASAYGVAAQEVKRPILITGESDRRLNVTVLAEGYRDSEQAQFFRDATNLIQTFFEAEPYRTYRGHFNVQAVFVASQESGSDHPSYPVYRDTYFNSSFDSGDRILSVPSGPTGLGRVNALLKSAAPETDLPILLVNDPVYGGSGGALVVVSRSAFSPEILVHESGHTLAGLGDEYTEAAHYVPPSEPPNTTRQTSRDRIKWNAWIDPTTPLPTPSTEAYSSVIGLFEGAQNQTTGWYRPKLDCGMRTLGVPFCEVCQEAVVKAIYERVRPAESHSPLSLTQVLLSPEPLQFSVALLQPEGETVQTQWLVNGSPVEGATHPVFEFDPTVLAKGVHTVQAIVQDTTPKVRSDPSKLLQQTVTWRIDKRFPESIKPSVLITAPGNRARLTNALVTVSGSARDNIGVTQVLYQLDNGPFQAATGTVSWTATVLLQPGANVFRVKSVDGSGNESIPKTRILNYVVLSPLGLTVQGAGTVTGASDGHLLEVGKEYRLRARAARGHLFQGWSGDRVSQETTLTITMQENLQLNAVFVPNPFFSLQGEYVGLFRNEAASSGLSRLRLKSSGAFSGKLSMSDGDYPFSGRFGVDNRAQIEVKRRGASSLQLAMTLNESEMSVSGTVKANDWESQLTMGRASTTEDWAGEKLTASVPGIVGEGFSLGDSIATIVVSAKDLKMSGYLGDGARFTQSIPRVNDGWPLFWRGGRAGSVAVGWVTTGETEPFTGEIDFLRERNETAATYPGGVTNRSRLQSSFYSMPSVRGGPLLELDPVTLILEGADLNVPYPIQVRGDFQPVSGMNDLKWRVDPRTGLAKGSVAHPGSGEKMGIQAVVLQNRTNVAGVFRGKDATGRVRTE